MKTSSEFLKNPDRVKALKKRRNEGRTWEQLEKEFKLKPTRGMAAYRVYNFGGSTTKPAAKKAVKAVAKKPTVVAKPKAKPSAKPAVAPVAKTPAAPAPAPVAPVAATPPPVVTPPVAPAPAPVAAAPAPVTAKAPPPRKVLEDLAARLTTLEFHGQEQADPACEIGTESVARSFRVPGFFSPNPEKKDEDWPTFSASKEAEARAKIHFSGMPAEVAVVDDEKSWFTVRVAPK